MLAPLLSIVTFAGSPCCRTAFLKNRKAAFLSRWAVSRKSTVWPPLSPAGRFLPLRKGGLQLRRELPDPAVNAGMVDLYATLFHHFFQIPVAQRIRQVVVIDRASQPFPHTHQFKGISQDKLPLYLGFYEFVYNAKRRG